MEMTTANQENAGPVAGGCRWFKALLDKLKSEVVEVTREAKKLGKDDPRRIIHSLKVGLAINLVSLFYYFGPLYEGFGISAMWAVITVVVVFEFSVGATLGKSLNRGVATLVAGILGVGAHRLASLFTERCEPILLGLFVFLLAAAVTFMRFFPRLKARYDYGLLIFILTFCLICVSGYRDDEVLDIAQKRLSTILIGGATAVIICIFICPIWAGGDLHNLVATNLEKLGNFLEGFGGEYFIKSGDNKSSLQYKSVLNSKCTEESLVNFAKWEPGHGRFRYRHPWDQYLKIGTLTRQCAYRIEALNNYLNSEIQAPLEIRVKIQESCTQMTSESSYALKELALAMRAMIQPSTANTHITNSKIAAKNLKSLLKTGLWQETNLMEIIPTATVASILIDIVVCSEKIAESVHELASLAHFGSADVAVTPEQPQPTHQGKLQPNSRIEGPRHVIKVDGSSRGLPEYGNQSLPTSTENIAESFHELASSHTFQECRCCSNSRTTTTKSPGKIADKFQN
ncbi:hypothetical protein F0562_001634 [Nyssa sinensis]|uniref:Aluminum-activated malate transporter n=1 Tax=Nyssa sinensis TaxID=561372 RepID=A0A5J5C3V6_9ASTE|nr:hypothetical protein F0562_001634 [Nyssa sinensis]